MQLTQAEAAFRTAKSDLGLRPVSHHKPDRVRARILVCFLALALWRSLEQWMQAKGLGSCAHQLIKEVAGIKSVDVLMPVKRGQVRTELRLRVVTTPEPAAAQLLAHPSLNLPKRPREIANVMPKNGGQKSKVRRRRVTHCTGPTLFQRLSRAISGEFGVRLSLSLPTKPADIRRRST